MASGKGWGGMLIPLYAKQGHTGARVRSVSGDVGRYSDKYG